MHTARLVNPQFKLKHNSEDRARILPTAIRSMFLRYVAIPATLARLPFPYPEKSAATVYHPNMLACQLNGTPVTNTFSRNFISIFPPYLPCCRNEPRIN